ncbi:MAG: DUF4339 domain-containing protein [Parachlamydiales bacterium]|nr:DUF4339 domain-containing protein [Parachlamydiales bacterium]
MDQINPFLTFIILFGIGLLCGYLAKGRGRRSIVWFWIGLMFGLFGLAALLIMPRLKKEALKEQLVTASHSYPVVEPIIIDDVVVIHDEGIREKNWYFLDDSHAIQGPMGFLQLYDACQNDKVNDQTYVWTEGMSDWQRVDTLAALQEELNYPKEY